MIFACFRPPTRLAFGLLAAICAACATAPRPAPASLALAGNERAVVEGRVTDGQGRAVAGIGVTGLPRGRDAGWSPAAVTDSNGRFRLVLIAPAEYGFLLTWRGRTVITPGEDDPSRLRIPVAPGTRREGIEIHLLRDAWDKIP